MGGQSRINTHKWEMSSYKILSWPNMIMCTVGSTHIQSTTCSARGKQYCWQDGSSRQKINLLCKISKSSYILLFDLASGHYLPILYHRHCPLSSFVCWAGGMALWCCCCCFGVQWGQLKDRGVMLWLWGKWCQTVVMWHCWCCGCKVNGAKHDHMVHALPQGI